MRLIDADKLIEQGWRLERHGESNELVGVMSIADVPTAFDIEVVVKELEKMKLVRVEQCHEDYEIEVMTASNFDDAIEIIRKGGVK